MNALPSPSVRLGPLVGRAVELSALKRRITAACAGESGCVFLVGEPGIGKTRLADEAAAVARGQGVRVLRGRSARSGASRMRPFAEALLGLAREGWSPPEALGPYLAVLGQLVPDWRAGSQPAAVAAAPFIHGEAILRVLGMSGLDPVLLILEDLHDADPDTIATLEYLVDNAIGARLAIFCTTRDVSGPALELADYVRRRDPDALLALPRLDAATTAELAAELLGIGRREVGGELREVLIRDGVGNPLVVTELLRDLVAADALVHRNGGWTTRESWRPGAPRSLSRSVADHLRREGPVTRRVLQAAAVLGDEFPADLLGNMAELDDVELWQVLESAVREQFLVPAAARKGWFAFRHPLLELAVRDELTPTVSTALALAAATAIETCGPMSEEWRVRAAMLRESAGDVAGAGVLFAAAGRHAAENGSPALAVDLLERALGALPPQRYDTTWAELTGLLVTALGVVGRYEAAFDRVGQLEAASLAGLPGEVAADLHLRLARVALRAEGADRVTPHVRAAREAIGELRADAQRAELDAIEALVAANSQDPDEAARTETLARRAIDRARAAGLPLVECDALLTLGFHYGNHNPEQALNCYRHACRVARENSLAALRSESLVLLGVHQWMWHADPTGLETAEAEAIADGAVMETRLAQLSLAVNAVFSARFEAARGLVDTAWSDIARLKLPMLGSYALAIKAVMHAHRGQEDALAAAVVEFDRWRGENDDEVPLVRGLALGVAALLRGEIAVGRAHLDSLRAPDGGFGAAKYYLCGEFGLAALVEAVDDGSGNGSGDGLAEISAGDSVDWTRQRAIAAETASRLPWNRQFVEFAHAVLLGRDGDLSNADVAVAVALATSEPFPLARYLALCLISPCAARDGWGEPVRWLNEAEAFFKDANLPAAAHRCRDQLRRLGESTRQWRHGSPDVPRDLWAVGVTAREYEVLLLIARHQTNREIAAELHLSHRTVERHVSSLLAKTGVAGRRDLAGYGAAGEAG